jgi:hypothetical protein
MKTKAARDKPISLVKELHGLLGQAIHSLVGTALTTPESSYLVWSTTHISRIASGYILLRENGDLYASRLLVRPVIESTFYVGAALKVRGLIYWKARSEADQDKKLFPMIDPKQVDKDTDDFKNALLGLDPTYPIGERFVDAFQAASFLNWTATYQGGYRTYSQYTHGTLRACPKNQSGKIHT